MASSIKILLVDDHPLVREGIRSSLERYPSIQILGEAANGKEALQYARQLCPDVVLMDLNMPEMNGFEATTLIRKYCPEARVIALTVHDSEEYVFRILRSGASGYLVKDTSPEELVRAIEAVARGEAFFGPRIAKILLQDVAHKNNGGHGSGLHSALSQRETDVLRSIAEGNTSKEIAANLKLSVRTVETYRIRIKRKLNARNTAELVSRARREQLI
ncbi:MAG TPA: response regulator transcription factor [Candidatus Limnocylindrales bacterium]|jgi:DNA-binding NarL/FixJ family response regulator|nr:response regulator transcription factor [Candidatus Limnocylindrales bacterium]